MAFWWDDYMNILAAATVVAAYTIVAGPMEFNGFGHDIWAVTPGKIVAFLKYYYIVSLVYLVARLAIRVSIVLFYSRVFSTPEHRLKIRITQIINIGLSFAFFFRLLDNRDSPTYHSQTSAACKEKAAYSHNVYDWSCSQIISKQANICRAIGVGSAKLAYVGMFTRTTNPTYDNMPMLRLCCIEIQLGVICSCMPSMPMLFRPFTDYVRTKSETAKRFDSGYANAPERMSSSKPYSEGTSYSTTYSRSADIPEAQGIRMMTNIHQSTSYWRVESDKNVLLREMPISQESV
ncbi:hypothetical protein M406DRAFT_66020 [Cryphonectria parasitica EP155]|uniref:Rhodopsin domain-containing protein n=1 Tax=Cryphonectria parasitica (strain ATCC 38755 / EP155) TaxID=660469 RepID=A0A9P4YBC2_CRYP1|nr:uncharacterized protein M406DRAFT_66020 [Cryphonectria parasitica EP155]KAF3769530.1 hypothetical protein M406DRAFT_66020 [Cryphonectria parasitica EP155]